MADIRPFPALHYNPAKVPDLSAVVTQPYDKVTPKMSQDYLARHPYNFVRLILPESGYESSARTCAEWLKANVLLRDLRPAFYILEEEFKLDKTTYSRKGFIGAIRVEEFEKGTVLPHEFTHSGPKADRLALLRATKKDYEQIFFLYPDEKGEIDGLLETSGEPDMEAVDEFGVTHRLWWVLSPERIRALGQAMSDRVVLIADGHHRYETALTYRQEMEKKGGVLDNAALRFKTAAFFKITDPGLVILPTHRLLKGVALKSEDAPKKVSELFAIQPVPDEKAKDELKKHRQEHAFVLYYGKGKSYLLILRQKERLERFFPQNRSPEYRKLDVALLHTLIIDRVFGIKPDQIEGRVLYERYWQDTVARVDNGEADCALFLNPTRPEQIQALAAKNERMPQKSTDFYPKLISGMVFMDVSPRSVIPLCARGAGGASQSAFGRWQSHNL